MSKSGILVEAVELQSGFSTISGQIRQAEPVNVDHYSDSAPARFPKFLYLNQLTAGLL